MKLFPVRVILCCSFRELVRHDLCKAGEASAFRMLPFLCAQIAQIRLAALAIVIVVDKTDAKANI